MNSEKEAFASPIERLMVMAKRSPPQGHSMALLHYRAIMTELSKAMVAELEHFHPGCEAAVAFLLRKVAELEMTEVLA